MLMYSLVTWRGVFNVLDLDLRPALPAHIPSLSSLAHELPYTYVYYTDVFQGVVVLRLEEDVLLSTFGFQKQESEFSYPQ